MAGGGASCRFMGAVLTPAMCPPTTVPLPRRPACSATSRESAWPTGCAGSDGAGGEKMVAATAVSAQ